MHSALCTPDTCSHCISFCLQVECRDAGDPAGWSSTPDLTFILMMEVLDNCPHDRIHRSASSGDWQQTHVVGDTSQVSSKPGLCLSL